MLAYDELLLREPNLLIPGRKPVGPVRSVFERRPRAFWLAGPGTVDVLSNPVFPSNVSPAVYESGGISLDGTDGSRRVGAGNTDETYIPQNLPITMIADFVVTSLSQNFELFHSGGTWNAVLYTGLRVFVTTAGAVHALYGDGDGAGSQDRRSFVSPNGVVSAGNRTRVVARVTGATSGAIWVNGQKQSVSTSGAGGTMNPGFLAPYLFGTRNGGTEIIVGIGRGYTAGWWEDALPDVLCRDLSADPYQFLVPA